MSTTSLPLAILLPEAEGCADCGGRLGSALVTSGAAVDAHPSSAGDRLIVHFAPPSTAEDVAAAARVEAATLARRFVHQRLPITGMDCADCARTLGDGVAALPGVLAAGADFLAGRLQVEYDAERTSLTAIARRVSDLGYSVASDTATSTEMRVIGLHCADCARTLEHSLAAQPGVLAVGVDFATARATITHDPMVAPVPALMRRVADAGFEADVAVSPADVPGGRRPAAIRQRDVELIVAALLLVVALVSGVVGAPAAWATVSYAAAVVIGGWRIARAGLIGLRATRAPDINVLMTIAVIGAMVLGEWAEAAWIVVLFSLGNLLEGLTVDRARRSIGRLVQLAPSTATVLHGETPVVEPAASVAVGATVLVRPGERVPLDGVVIEGQSALDQSPITGESALVDKGPGDAVFAGTVNSGQPLVVRVERAAQDSTLARIVRLVEQAQSQRAPMQRFIDQFARWYTPAVIVGALLVAIIPPFFGVPLAESVYRGLVLLVIACPCALVISTPVAFVAALGSAARRGILIKGGAYLETLGRLRTVAFDKTGTLTYGRPVVTDVVPLGDESADAVLALAAALEGRSEHALAEAIVAAAERRGLLPPPVDAVTTVAGQGVTAVIDRRLVRLGSPRLFTDHPAYAAEAAGQVAGLQARGRTVMLLGDDDRLLGLIATADQVRPRAAAALASLRDLGVARLVMLTGDNAAAARAIADVVGPIEVRAGLLPDDKTAAVAELEANAGPVAMVGDGINDAPALARASVGVAMAVRGTATALETADVALMADDLTRLPLAVRLGRDTLTVVRQNIALALIIKVVFLALAVTGMVDLWIAVLADVGGSLLVTANALRLLRTPRDRRLPAADHQPQHQAAG